MKKKFSSGIEKLSEVERKYKISDFLRTIILGYRAYGNFCQGFH